MAEDNLEVPVFPTITPGTTEDSDSSQGSDGEANKKADPIVVADKEKKVDAEADNADAKADDSKKDPAKTEEERKLQVRGKSKEDFIAERKQKQLDKLDAQIEAKRKEAETNGVDTDEDDTVDPEDAKTVKNVIQKEYGDKFEAMEQLKQTLEKQGQEQEVNSFLSTSETAKLFTDKEKILFREFIAHPSRSQVPYESIALEIVGPKRLIEHGAELEREANKKAMGSKVGGNAGKQEGGGAVDFDSMTNAEFEAYKLTVK